MNFPAMSGADPCTGSNIEGNFRSGLMLADGAMPIDPATAGPRSDRMSPNRLEPTTTSNQSGCCTKCAHRMSMWNWSVRMSGYDLPISAKRSSQYGMVKVMPFDLVAEVRCFVGRVRASSNAYFRMRSTPWRLNTLCCDTNSRSDATNMRPPTDEYSPSVFSRTT